MSSRLHLRRTLHWGDWPRDDFTLPENRADLQRHWDEFERREGYAYTVLMPDRSTCVGCVYLVPVPGGADDLAMLAYWVIEPELAYNLDAHLFESLLAWFERDWPFRRVAISTHAENERGHAIARAAGRGTDSAGFEIVAQARREETLFVWTRPE